LLCGAKNSQRRERLAEYIRQRQTDTCVFKAEDVWSAISKNEELSALEMEEELARLSDLVIIIVESPGTFSELGAFSLSPELRKKLLPILNVRYRGDDSFIETGPVRWVDKDSDFRPSIWVRHESILEACGELDTRLENILSPPVRIDDLAKSPKHFLFFICDLVAIFGPCPSGHIAFYVAEILGAEQNSVEILIRLGMAMGLIKSVRTSGDLELFYRPLIDGKLMIFHYTKKHFGIPTLRAKALSVMQTIPSGRTALRDLERASCC
jgi:hypothetical protein